MNDAARAQRQIAEGMTLRRADRSRVSGDGRGARLSCELGCARTNCRRDAGAKILRLRLEGHRVRVTGRIGECAQMQAVAARELMRGSRRSVVRVAGMRNRIQAKAEHEGEECDS